nr:hypothetical protein GPVRGNEL_GPVRGNEL_CDS_0013 [Caudoviricetes sp.]
MTDKQALYDISYKNAIMYSRAMPMPNDKSEDNPLYDDSKDANNPDNFNKYNDFDEEEIVRL